MIARVQPRAAECPCDAGGGISGVRAQIGRVHLLPALCRFGSFQVCRVPHIEHHVEQLCYPRSWNLPLVSRSSKMISIKRIIETRVDTLSLGLLFHSRFPIQSPILPMCESVEAKTTCRKRMHISILYLDAVDLTKEGTSDTSGTRRCVVYLLSQMMDAGGAADFSRDTEPWELIKFYCLRVNRHYTPQKCTISPTEMHTRTGDGN